MTRHVHGDFDLPGMREHTAIVKRRLEVRRDATMGRRCRHVVLAAAILLAGCAGSFASEQAAALATRVRSPNTRAQGGDALQSLKVIHLTTDDGLSHNRIYSIVQDRRGFMWFATQDGLNRYDGHAFVVYKKNPDDASTLSANFIQSLIEDHHGNLWIGTWGGLDRFDPTTERFTHYRYRPEDPNSISGDAIKSIVQDSRGYLWVGTVDEGLNRLDPATETFTRYRTDSKGEVIGTVNSIIEDSHRDIWFVGTRGLFQLSTQTGQITRPSATIDRFAADYVHADKAGNLWILAYSPVARLVKYDRHVERFTEYPFEEGAVGIPNSMILDDGEDGLWLASSQGLYHFDLRTEQLTDRFRHDGTNPDSLNDNSVSSLYRDRAGVLWVGTENRGLNVLNFRQKQFGSYRHRPDDRGSLSPGVVSALHQDRNGILWVGFTLFALDKLDRQTGQITHFPPGSENTNALGKGSSLRNNIYRDAQGYLWFGGWDSGLIRFDERSGQFTRYRHRPGDPNSLLSDNILCVYQDRSGKLWVGLVEGLSSFDPTTEKFINYRRDPAQPDSVGIRNVSAIYQDRSGTLWTGTWMGTFSRFDEKTNTFVNVSARSRDAHKLSGVRIHAIHEDEAGTLWLGTLEGLFRYDRENETLSHYTVNQGLPSGEIQCILSDRSGRLWLGTRKGLSRFDPQTGRFRNYDTSDGLQSNDFSAGCYEDRQSGELLFGGDNGITTFYPESIRDDDYVPPVVLTSFKIFNRPVPIGAESVLTKAIPYVEALTLSHRDNVFSFEFAALSYGNSHKNRYRYKLDNLEPDWNEVDGKQRLATYTNLDPGEYLFRVQGSNSDSVWNEEGVSLAILITPPWWRTTSFRALFAIVVLTLTWAAYQLRLRQLHRQLEMTLAARIGERTRIARDLHDTLLQDFQAVLLMFQSGLKFLPDRPVEASRKLQQALTSAIVATTTARNAVQDLRSPEEESNDLVGSLTKIAEEVTGEDRPAVQVSASGTPLPLKPTLRGEVYRIAAEALRNALRHAEARQILVDIRYDQRELRVRVRDDGVGVDNEELRNKPPARHFGLHGMQERAEAVGGRLEVLSKAGEGTLVDLSIPAAAAYAGSARRSARFNLLAWPRTPGDGLEP